MKKAKTGEQIIYRGSKMAKDKSCIGVIFAPTAAASVAQNIALMPYAFDAGTDSVIAQAQTVSGLRWMIDFGPTTAFTTFQRCIWMIWIRRKKAPIQPITPGTTTPQEAFNKTNENDILIWGAGLMTVKQDRAHFEGATKTQRKMQPGDQLVFSYCCTGAATDSIAGSCNVQTFFKS